MSHPSTRYTSERVQVMVEGLPVHGYVDQPQSAVDQVNRNKVIEEQLLRMLDTMKDQGHQFDQRWLAIARTDLERGFMCLNRAIFKPARVALPDDPDDAR